MPSYQLLMDSGLYGTLVEQNRLIPHREVTSPDGAKTIEPDLLPFISYPYEWSFSQLKAAALATLAIQKAALVAGLTLRDASAYNIQFRGAEPLLIDTLSFEAYEDGSPWQAYRQFCQHFLAPLALMSYVDPQLLQLLRVHIDGVPLPLTAKLLPRRAKLRPGMATHLVLHARLQRQHEGVAALPTRRRLSLTGLNGLLESLEGTIKALKPPHDATQWGDYYDHTNYDAASFDTKGQLVDELIRRAKPRRAVDLGANNGVFSRIAARHCEFVISADIDPLAVEANYQRQVADADTRLAPILIDLTNPSPGLGWANRERSSFSERAQSDVAIALALIHHLAIANNLPLSSVADYFCELAPHLIIEFVPKSDSQVKRLLATREDIFGEYNEAGFEAAFDSRYTIVEKQPVKGSERIMYLMRRR